MLSSKLVDSNFAVRKFGKISQQQNFAKLPYSGKSCPPYSEYCASPSFTFAPYLLTNYTAIVFTYSEEHIQVLLPPLTIERLYRP
jgi:hypothetical protein